MEKGTEDVLIVVGVVLVVVVLFTLNHAAPTKVAPITLVPQNDVNAAVSQTQAAYSQAQLNVANQALLNQPQVQDGNLSLLNGLAAFGSGIGAALNGNGYGTALDEAA